MGFIGPPRRLILQRKATLIVECQHNDGQRGGEMTVRSSDTSSALGTKRDVFFSIKKEMQRCVFITGMRDCHGVHVQDLAEVKAQQREKRAKKIIASKKGIDNSKGLLIHAIYRHGQYLSKACIKGNVGQVDRILRSLTSQAAQRRFLRSNIEMRTLGLGGEFAKLFTITWSVGGGLRSIDELAKHLKLIIKQEKKTKEHIPEKPHIMLPKRRVTPIVGRVTEEVRALDRKYFSDVTKFHEDADVMGRELERKGAFSLYSMMQPELKLSIKDLLKDEEKIDVLCELFVGEGENTMKMKVLHWCQGG